MKIEINTIKKAIKSLKFEMTDAARQQARLIFTETRKDGIKMINYICELNVNDGAVDSQDLIEGIVESLKADCVAVTVEAVEY